MSALAAIGAVFVAILQKRSNDKAVKGQAADVKRSAELAERSAKAAEESAWAAKEGMMVSNRPWVTVARIDLDDWEQPTARLPRLVRIVFKDGGTTPALDAKLTAYFRISPEFSPVYDGAGETELTFGVIGPNVEISADLSLWADKDQERAFIDGNAVLYTFGQVVYRDIFEHQYTYSWAYVYRPGAGLVHTDIHGGILLSPPATDYSDNSV